MDSKLTEIRYVRLSKATNEKLEIIASKSVAPNISDHIRFAVERYVKEHEPVLKAHSSQVYEKAI